MGHGSIQGKTWFEDGRQAVRVAESKGCHIRYSNGDHVVIEPPGYDPIVVVNRPMGRGLGCKVWKAFKLAGLLVIAFMLYSLITCPAMAQVVLEDVQTSIEAER